MHRSIVPCCPDRSRDRSNATGVYRDVGHTRRSGRHSVPNSTRGHSGPYREDLKEITLMTINRTVLQRGQRRCRSCTALAGCSTGTSESVESATSEAKSSASSAMSSATSAMMRPPKAAPLDSSAQAAPDTPSRCPPAPARSRACAGPGGHRRRQQPGADNPGRRAVGQAEPLTSIWSRRSTTASSPCSPPTDEAFGKVDPATIDKLKTDSDLLTSVLTYHVVSGQAGPEAVVGEHKTVEGQMLKVTGSGDDLMVNDAGVVRRHQDRQRHPVPHRHRSCRRRRRRPRPAPPKRPPPADAVAASPPRGRGTHHPSATPRGSGIAS